jgi:RimJ/RimL family protein N-acetyltransferase
MVTANLTLASVFEHPQTVTYQVGLREGESMVLRPLQPDDVSALASFLEGLSPQTRHFSIFASYDWAMAQALCDAINRYDKLRFVVEIAERGEVAALFEFSFDLPERDLQRYAEHGVTLNAVHTCRWGPTIADAYQNRGLGSRTFPYMVETARRFGRRRIILWGGVLADNARAIHFYEKQGFRHVGLFKTDDDLLCIDMVLDLRAGTDS